MRRHFGRQSLRAPTSIRGWAVLAALLLAVGCGGGGPATPYVDPHPLADAGGLVDRVILEAGASDSFASDGAPAGLTTDGSTDQLVVGGGADGASTDAGPNGDGPSIATTVDVEIVAPTPSTLQVATARFAPQATVSVATAPGTSDDVKQVDAQLWTTDAMPVQLSITHLVLLHKTTATDAGTDVDGGGVGGGGVAAVDAGGSVGPGDAGAVSSDAAAAADGGGPARDVAVFAFGDTPVDLSSVATGTYELRVIATTATSLMAMASCTFRVDAGPVIRVISPTVDQASRGSVFASVEVVDPYSDILPTVQLSVANIPITSVARTDHLYEATILETISTPPLSGQQLLEVRATNAAGVSAHPVVVRFTFDDVGPTISNVAPAVGDLIGGIVELSADVNDPSGVDPQSVVAVVAHGDQQLTVALDRDPSNTQHFAHLFDTRRLGTSVLYPTVSFRASDIPGNQSSIGYTVAVDDTPPLADLDPPSDLRARKDDNGTWRCSWPFDPLGTDAIDEGDLLRQVFDVRARVEDQGNTPAAGGADITPVALLDPAHVELLVLDDTRQALVVDTDGDGLCDQANPKLVPTTTPMSSEDALLINLATVPRSGSADFTADLSILAAGFADCVPGDDSVRPDPLCRTTDLQIAIPARGIDVPALWTIPNVVPSTPQCVGNQLDALGNNLADGPLCLAVRAYDKLGNVQVSRVLHVCLDHDGVGGECPFSPVFAVDGGSPVRVTTVAPHGLASGDRVLLGRVPTLHDANGLWKVTVVGPTSFTLDGSTTPSGSASGGQFMPWTSPSDCTGRQTAVAPVAVDDTAACLPWRAFPTGEHLDVDD